MDQLHLLNKDRVWNEVNLKYEELVDYAVNSGGHSISVKVYRDLESGKGKYIEIQSTGIKNIESDVRKFISDFTETLENLQKYFSENGVSEIHLFQGGMIPMALALQNVYSNRYVVHAYHWVPPTYVYAAELDKGARESVKSEE